MSGRPSAAERVRVPEAFLSRTDLRELGLERRAIDAVFRECPVIELPGYSRPLVRVADYLVLLDGHTYSDRCGKGVRPGREHQSRITPPSGRSNNNPRRTPR
jgi:hypothetical protein